MAKTKSKKTTTRADELLKTIFQYVVRIANERDVDKLLVYLADMGRDLVFADRCTVWLVDRKAEKIWSKVAHGVDRIEIPLTKGIAGYVAETGEHLVINDAYSDDRFDQHMAGIKANRYAKKFGLRLRYKLFEQCNPIATRKEAEYKEALLGEHLRKRGFAVWWN